MKRVLIGGFLALIASISLLPIYEIASNNLVSSWSTLPGRFFSTLSSLGLLPFVAIFYLILALGIIILGIEYCKKD